VHGVLDAGVRAPDLVRIAAATGIAVEEILAATYAADAAPGAVENLFLDSVVIPEVAELTKVAPEHLAARRALPRRTLAVLTFLANHLTYLRPVDLVAVPAITPSLVVAMPTPEGLTTTRCNDSAPPPVVATSL